MAIALSLPCSHCFQITINMCTGAAVKRFLIKWLLGSCGQIFAKTSKIKYIITAISLIACFFSSKRGGMFRENIQFNLFLSTYAVDNLIDDF